MVMNVSWMREEVKKVGAASRDQGHGVSQHELSYLILTTILRLYSHPHFKDEEI